MASSQPISHNLVGRLSFYRRMIERGGTGAEGERTHIFSHEIAELTGFTPALVRRDLMTIGFSGNPKKGYHLVDLLASIGKFLDAPEVQKVALVGVGNLGRALLTYFAAPRSNLQIVAAFDIKPDLVHQMVQGYHCYAIEELEKLVPANRIQIGILAVPHEAAQSTAERLIGAGCKGLLNFAPTVLQTPEGIYVKNIDLTMSLEQVAYFSR